MNKDFLEKQKNAAFKKLTELKDVSDKQPLKDKISIIHQFISSIIEPEGFTDIQKEDFRKLALELNFTEGTDFTEWLKVQKQLSV